MYLFFMTDPKIKITSYSERIYEIINEGLENHMNTEAIVTRLDSIVQRSHSKFGFELEVDD